MDQCAVDIQGRPKHFYSIHQKMVRQGRHDEIYDLMAVRIIVDTVRECYIITGIIHAQTHTAFKDLLQYPSPTCTSLSTPPLLALGRTVRIRFEHGRCTASQKECCRHWLYKRARQDKGEQARWSSSGKLWSGCRRRRIPRSSWTP